MKRVLVFSILIFFYSNVFAKHISGGEMSYIYLGPGTNPGTLKYQVTLKLYRECNAPPDAAQLDPTAVFTVFNTATFQLVRNITGISGSATEIIQKIPDNPCIRDEIELAVCFQFKTYTTIIDNLPENARGYTVSYQRCCRIDGMENINSNSVGSTYFALIPGNLNPGAETNTSPVFVSNDAVLICSGRPVLFDFHAVDADGDSLVYLFYRAFTGGTSTNTAPDPAANPPYPSVSYINGYSFSQPLGALVSINSNTGLISGIAPNLGAMANSIFAITVLVNEYRDGIKIGEHFKDLQVRVVDCQSASALLDPRPTTCDGFTVSFTNDASNNPQPTYYWDFGDGNTSTQINPTHTYTLAGDYTLKLVVDRGLPCSDSTTTIVKVYPGFFPDFEGLGNCKNVPVQFNDKSRADYGIINKWTWNFGDPSSTNNTSSNPNPTHIYANTGIYTVTCLIESSKGCSGLITKTIEILAQPPLDILGDTLICSIDTLQLNAIGSGSFLWSPNYMINNINIANPLVSPDVTTTYTVQITDAFGCQGSKPVTIKVVDRVTQFAGADTTICKTDAIVLKLTSDALYYTWTENPPGGNTLNNPALKNPTARPLVTTTYHVVGSIGKCIAENDITVTPIPYPVANAGPDNTICFGNSAQLNASGGSIYSWSPAVFLTATNIPNPQSIRPTDNVRYIVTVRDVLGCPKPVRDTMILFVAKIIANAGPRDTSVVIGQPLQLNATGGINYAWTPTTWLDNPAISNPIALPQNDIQYMVRVSNNVGCFNDDSIRVRVFKLKPDLLVPNAFTPNGDDKNSIFRPIPIGMKSIDIFRVYNRWGQLLYSGNGNSAGWDGTFGGKKQETATYVWIAEGTDYLNNKIKRKGSVVLIR